MLAMMDSCLVAALLMIAVLLSRRIYLWSLFKTLTQDLQFCMRQNLCCNILFPLGQAIRPYLICKNVCQIERLLQSGATLLNAAADRDSRDASAICKEHAFHSNEHADDEEHEAVTYLSTAATVTYYHDETNHAAAAGS
jgi:endonuclease/exonuclease/phosphatase (EEP) superfamily protein YafD